MECVEAKALKSRELREQGVKSNQQAFLDDLWCLNGANGVPGEDFSVDCFLDFSAGEFEDGEEEEEEDKDEGDSSADSSQDNNSNSAGQSSESLLAAEELSVPVDDVAGLEWVSQFVDDSVPEFPQFYSFTKPKPDTRPVLANPRFFPLRPPAKARTKRTRTNRRDWSVVTFIWTQSPSTSTEPKTKKPRKKQAVQTDGSQVQRRCSHCQVQKTPQWRTGPNGAKTLCNACGVRFKSGRLLPEYRPACSPTFSGEVHSNSHRKVLEMRKRKEKEVGVGEGKETGLNPV